MKCVHCGKEVDKGSAGYSTKYGYVCIPCGDIGDIDLLMVKHPEQNLIVKTMKEAKEFIEIENQYAEEENLILSPVPHKMNILDFYNLSEWGS